jgi:hypothetical protein
MSAWRTVQSAPSKGGHESEIKGGGREINGPFGERALQMIIFKVM